MRVSMTMTQDDIIDLVKKAGRAGIIPVPADYVMMKFEFVRDDVGDFDLVVELHKLLEKPGQEQGSDEDSKPAGSMRL